MRTEKKKSIFFFIFFGSMKKRIFSFVQFWESTVAYPKYVGIFCKNPNFLTCFDHNSSRNIGKQLKSISNESYGPGEHFWPPICTYQNLYVEVTAQKILDFSIFAIFDRPRKWAFFGCSKIKKRKTRSEGRFLDKISKIWKIIKFVLWCPLNNLRS